MTADELSLIRQLLSGSHRAWDQFVHQFQGLVLSRIRRTAQECNRQLDINDAEDLCADVFAALVANHCSALRRFEGRSSLATWLSVIARRTCLKFLERHRNLPGDEEGLLAAAVTNDDQLARLIHGEDRSRLERLWGTMSPGDQQVLQLFYLENCSYAEIGRELGVATNSVGPRLHRAQQRLKRVWNADERTPQQRVVDARQS